MPFINRVQVENQIFISQRRQVLFGNDDNGNPNNGGNGNGNNAGGNGGGLVVTNSAVSTMNGGVVDLESISKTK